MLGNHGFEGTTLRWGGVVHKTALVLGILCLIASAPASGARVQLLLLALLLIALSWIASAAHRHAELAQMSARLEGIADGDFTHRLTRPKSRDLARLGRAAERALRSSAEALARSDAEGDELRNVLASVGHGLLALDPDQRVRSANGAAERLLGLVPGAYRGRLLQEVCRQPELHRFVEMAMQSKGGHSGELQLGGSAGTAVQAVAEPLRLADGAVDGVLLALDDITRLRRLESMRSDFAANVSHELRTPITNIKGYAETLQQVGFADEEQAARFLGVITRSTRRLGALVDDLLALASLEQAGAAQRLEFGTLTVGPILDSVVEQVGAAISARHLTVTVTGERSLRIHGNQLLVEQAMVNLLSNAAKHSPERGTIRLAASSVQEAGQEMTELSVSDDGPGISPKHTPRIFERFYRVDNSRTAALGGTGIGLALVKHIATVHGGSATVQSEFGQGSTFRIRLPAASQPVPVHH